MAVAAPPNWYDIYVSHFKVGVRTSGGVNNDWLSPLSSLPARPAHSDGASQPSFLRLPSLDILNLLTSQRIFQQTLRKIEKKDLLHTLILSKNTFLLIHCKKKKTLRIATSGLAGQTRNNEIHNVISSLVLILLMVGWQAREDLQDSDKGWIMMGKWTGNFPTYTANIWTFSYETVNLQS